MMAAPRSRQLGFLLNPARFEIGGGASGPMWNSADKAGSIALSSADTVAIGTSGGVRGVTGKSSGKWYVEFVAGSTMNNGNTCIGIATSGATLGPGTNVVALGGTYLVGRSDALEMKDGTNFGSVGATFAPIGTIYGFAFDGTGPTITFSRNGVARPARSVAAGTYFPYGNHAGGSQNINFQIAASPTYLPSGFSYWD